MARKPQTEYSESHPTIQSARTPEARENQIISLAYDEVERRIREGKASSAELCHFLRMGSQKERLEKEKLEEENKMLKAKTKSIESTTMNESLYAEVMNAIMKYTGQSTNDEDDPDVY